MRESSLGKVPSAASADKAATVDTVVVKRATAAPGQTVVLATKGTLSVQVRCVDEGGGELSSFVEMTTAADNAAFDANDSGSDDGDLDVVDGAIQIVQENGTSQNIEDGAFTALTAAGVSWQAYGFAGVKLGGANTCTGEMTFTG